MWPVAGGSRGAGLPVGGTMDEAEAQRGAGAACFIVELERRLRFLTGREISMIDDLLASVAPFGEVRLAVQKGRLRFVSSVKSQDALELSGKASPRKGKA